MKAKNDLEAVAEGYLGYMLEVKRSSPGTVKDVRCTLRRVTRIMRKDKPDIPLWKLELRDFLNWLEHERESGTSPQTLGKYVSHVRGLLEYAWRGGRSQRNALDGFSLQDCSRVAPPDCLSEAEAQQLIQHCPSSTANERRDRLVVLIFYGCGLRTSELCDLRLQDVDRERREVFVAKGKGHRQRRVPIPEAVYTELLAYLAERGGKQGPLFRTLHARRPLSISGCCEIVRLAAARASLARPLTPKVLRHSFATHLMNRGVDLSIISVLMGHRSPQESGVYLHVLGERCEQAAKSLDVPGVDRKETS